MANDMKKRKKIVFISVCIALAVIILGGAILSDELLFIMPTSYIKNKLSKEIPLGSSIQEV
jgi:cytochrome c-type biogenesis protein CcmE